MKTPSHAMVNLGLLSIWSQPNFALPILIGAILPDLPIFVLYFWAKFWRKVDDKTIWHDLYYQKFWQDWVALFHSFPIGLCLGAIAFGIQWPLGQWLAVSLILHNLGDFPLHHDDAHRHFYPLSNFRFVSPLSYWDPRHYGKQVSAIEDCLTLVCCVVLLVSPISWGFKLAAIAIGCLDLLLIPFSPIRIALNWILRNKPKLAHKDR